MILILLYCQVSISPTHTVMSKGEKRISSVLFPSLVLLLLSTVAAISEGGHSGLKVKEEKCCFKVDTNTKQIVDSNGECRFRLLLIIMSSYYVRLYLLFSL